MHLPLGCFLSYLFGSSRHSPNKPGKYVADTIGLISMQQTLDKTHPFPITTCLRFTESYAVNQIFDPAIPQFSISCINIFVTACDIVTVPGP